MMKALVYEQQRLQLVERPAPQPTNHEVLLQILMAGICNTDLEIMAGYVDFQGILGHEFVGRVVDDPAGELVGERVVGAINIPCHSCAMCRAGMPTHCARRQTIGIHGKDGCFAEFMTLPRENLYRVPDDIPDEHAVLVEPLAAALEIVEQVHIPSTYRVIVLGDGKLGLLTAYALWAVGKQVTLLGRHPEKLKIAATLGIETSLVNQQVSTPADVVIECTGRRQGIDSALSLVRPRGTIVLKTTTAEHPSVNLSQIVVNEITLIGSRCGPFVPALRLFQRQERWLEGFIDSVYPLSQGLQAFERAKTRGVLKILFTME